MTHVHAPVIRSHAEIADQARTIHPVQLFVRAVLTTITAIFVALGWVVGRSWFLTVFTVLWIGSRLAWLGSCLRYGYHTGAKNTLIPPKE